jgi:hypothetical protein
MTKFCACHIFPGEFSDTELKLKDAFEESPMQYCTACNRAPGDEAPFRAFVASYPNCPPFYQRALNDFVAVQAAIKLIPVERSDSAPCASCGFVRKATLSHRMQAARGRCQKNSKSL